MPRRRMIGPDFWKDADIRKLSREERLFFIGCISNADDDGRLLGHPAYLKAAIFMYDDDLDLDDIKKLRDSVLSKTRNLILYTNEGEEYMAFLKWHKHQSPSHAQPSELPAPPGGPALIEPFNDEVRQEIYARDNYTCQYCGTDLHNNPHSLSIDHILPLRLGGSHLKTNLVTACKSCNNKKRDRTPEQANMSLIPECKANLIPNMDANLIPNMDANLIPNMDANLRPTQVSLVKVSIGKYSGVQEDFTKFLHTEKDLTDFLTTTLKKYLPRGPTQTMPVVKKLWVQATGSEINDSIFQVIYTALRKHPAPVLAVSLVKAVKYSPGKTNPAHYVQTILEEQQHEYDKARPP